jgi:hypothetical protein
MSLNYEDVDDLRFNNVYNIVDNLKYDTNNFCATNTKNNGKNCIYCNRFLIYKVAMIVN